MMLMEQAHAQHAVPIIARALAVVLVASGFLKSVAPTETLDVERVVWGLNRPSSVLLLEGLLILEGLLAAALWLYGKPADFLLTVAFLIVVTLSPVRQMLIGSKLGCGCGLSLPGNYALASALMRNGRARQPGAVRLDVQQKCRTERGKLFGGPGLPAGVIPCESGHSPWSRRSW